MQRLMLVAALALAGCSSAEPIRFEATHEEVRAAVADVTSFVRAGWHLPLRARVRLSNGEDGRPLPPEQEAREAALAARQVAAAREAYARAAFDFFALDVDVGRVRAPRVRFTGPERRLAVELPAPTSDEEGAIVDASGLLAALADGFAWDRVGRWYEGETADELRAALARDLTKLERLEDQLALDCHRLELLAATLDARAAATGQDPLLTPSEATFARAAQFRATFALHRVLNTFARWREAGLEDDAFGQRDGARLVLLRARLVHEAYLSWLLETIVGGRPVLAVWEDGWWHRNPLYEVLDAKAALDFVELDDVTADPGSIPAGAVRALLELRCDDGLEAAFEDVDAAAADLAVARFVATPLEAPARSAWARLDGTRAVIDGRGISGFTAWKELWDARLKGGLQYPLYHVVASIAEFLGDTRTTGRPPALRGARLEELATQLRPGDVLLVRQDHFLSNIFLPGFWPHAVLYLGPEADWTALRLAGGVALKDDPVVRAVLPRLSAADGEGPPRAIEAVSEGVVFSSLEHAMAKDYVVVLRPELPEASVAAAIRRALALHGRPYDFDFDFATDDRIVCTELVYRAYNPDLNFRVQVDAGPAGPTPCVPGVLPVMGRLTMPANEVARYALYMQDHPDALPALGYPGRRLRLILFVDSLGGEAIVHEGEAAWAPFLGSVGR